MNKKYRNNVSWIYKIGTSVSILFILIATIENIVSKSAANTILKPSYESAARLNFVEIMKGGILFDSDSTYYLSMLILVLTPNIVIIYLAYIYFRDKNYLMFMLAFMTMIIIVGTIIFGIT